MQLHAEIRESFGSLKTKVLRNDGKAPASIYKQDGTILHISLSQKEIEKAVENYKFLNTCAEIIFGKEKFKVLPKSIDFHPIKDTITHVEFKEVPKKGNVQVLVPIVVLNMAKSLGIKAGGKLNLPQHNVLIECKPDIIPENIQIDIGNYGIGRSIFTKDLTPEGDYVFPKNSFVLSITGRGKKDKGEEQISSTPTPNETKN